MKIKTWSIVGTGIILAGFASIFFAGVLSGIKTPPVAGSIGSDAYNSTTTDTTWNPANITTKFKLLKNGPGILGSVVITAATAGTINLYDGTTTSSASRTIAATTTLAQMGASVAAGTYTFDVAFSTGLIAEFPTTGAASSTITWK